mmetsp:Transcript_48247/g.109365  ORF Transcript_48247/g.109365 Transcript_48247/m.109365 type:complete len:456 (+) Transcript_48247:127-1494(+)
MDDYHAIKQIGEGAFGEVFMAKHRKTDQVVAIKHIKRQFSTWDECMQLKELTALRKLKHRCIIALHEAVRHQSNGSLYFVFEYMDTNLHVLIQNSNTAARQGMEEEEAGHWLRQTLQGLAYMHTNGFFHRDIKPDNLLIISKERRLKLADFGLVREIRARPPFTEYVSTRWYRAPECLLKSTRYNSPVDVWACGCILGEMLLGRPMFPGTSQFDTLSRIFTVVGAPNPDSWADGFRLAGQMGFRIPSSRPAQSMASTLGGCSIDCADLAEQLLAINPSRRPSCQEVLSISPVVKGRRTQPTAVDDGRDDGGEGPDSDAELDKILQAENAEEQTDMLPETARIHQPPSGRSSTRVFIEEDDQWLSNLENHIDEILDVVEPGPQEETVAVASTAPTPQNGVPAKAEVAPCPDQSPVDEVDPSNGGFPPQPGVAAHGDVDAALDEILSLGQPGLRIRQ